MGALARQYLDTHSSWPRQLADTIVLACGLDVLL
jgi:hypothetical protein